MSTILWLIGILGGLGGGLWIVSLFVPSVAAVLAAIIRFLATPLGQAVAVAALCALCFFAGNINGSRSERAKCVAAQQAAERAAAQRDVDQGRIAGEDEANRMAELEEQARKDRETIDAYQKRLEANAAARGCVLGPDDLRGL